MLSFQFFVLVLLAAISVSSASQDSGHHTGRERRQTDDSEPNYDDMPTFIKAKAEAFMQLANFYIVNLAKALKNIKQHMVDGDYNSLEQEFKDQAQAISITINWLFTQVGVWIKFLTEITMTTAASPDFSVFTTTPLFEPSTTPLVKNTV